jgi:hypothetical protein
MHALAQPNESYPARHDEQVALRAAYRALIEFRSKVVGCCLDGHKAPVSVLCLRQCGVPDALLNWLQFQHHVEHLQSFITLRGRKTNLCQSESITPGENSFFTLTNDGKEFGDYFLARASAGEKPRSHGAADLLHMGRLVPHYD